MIPGLELRGRHLVGQDPREMTREELREMGHEPMSPLQAIRAHCLDCCVYQEQEVALCTAVKCPSWPSAGLRPCVPKAGSNCAVSSRGSSRFRRIGTAEGDRLASASAWRCELRRTARLALRIAVLVATIARGLVG